MSYKYYSIMRPVGIGTFPCKPEKITNYPEGRKSVKTLDGSEILAWGELTYAEPLTEKDVRQYELRGEFEYMPWRHVGYWMRDKSWEIIKLGEKYFVLGGWNGNVYGHCFEVLTTTKMIEPKVEYTLTPVYYYETNAGIAMMNDMTDLEEETPEWNEKVEKLNEIISYSVKAN